MDYVDWMDLESCALIHVSGHQYSYQVSGYLTIRMPY